MQQRRGRGRYLDVSEYILKEYSPMTKAMNADFRLTERCPLERHATPEIAPIDHDGSTLNITPFLHGLLDFDDDQLDDFLLDGGSAEGRREARREGRRRRRSNSLVLLHFEDELEGIMEESDFADYSLSSSESAPDDPADEEQDGDGSAGESEGGVSLSQQQLKTQSQYHEKVQKYLRQPRATLLREMSRLSEGKGQLNQNQKLENIKKTIQSYIVDFQQPSFDDAWNQLSLPLAQKVHVLAQGINLTFKKRIGSLTFQQRRLKLLKYLQKKRMRKWRKKVSYDCRKKVADSRLRIKGKFVTREQVCSQLGLVDLEQFTGDELKEMLERKLEEGREKSAE